MVYMVADHLDAIRTETSLESKYLRISFIIIKLRTNYTIVLILLYKMPKRIEHQTINEIELLINSSPTNN
jgi:hypothetical protein